MRGVSRPDILAVSPLFLPFSRYFIKIIAFFEIGEIIILLTVSVLSSC